MNVVRGSVVRSLAGRDTGQLFVAVAVADRFVYIADGKERRLLSPKKKNARHISPCPQTLDMTELTDKKLRRELSALRTQGAEKSSQDRDRKERV